MQKSHNYIEGAIGKFYWQHIELDLDMFDKSNYTFKILYYFWKVNKIYILRQIRR